MVGMYPFWAPAVALTWSGGWRRNMKRVSVAFTLWILGCFGVLGLHRFYLGRVGTGFLWLATGGLFTVGAFVDGFRLGRMVDEANAAMAARRQLAVARGSVAVDPWPKGRPSRPPEPVAFSRSAPVAPRAEPGTSGGVRTLRR